MIAVTVCGSCAGPRDGGLLPALARALQAAGLAHRIATTGCMSGCARPATVAFRAPGKTAYLFGDLTGADIADLVTFACAYDAAPDGSFADARFLGGLRHKALARIPG